LCSSKYLFGPINVKSQQVHLFLQIRKCYWANENDYLLRTCTRSTRTTRARRWSKRAVNNRPAPNRRQALGPQPLRQSAAAPATEHPSRQWRHIRWIAVNSTCVRAGQRWKWNVRPDSYSTPKSRSATGRHLFPTAPVPPSPIPDPLFCGICSGFHHFELHASTTTRKIHDLYLKFREDCVHLTPKFWHWTKFDLASDQLMKSDDRYFHWWRKTSTRETIKAHYDGRSMWPVGSISLDWSDELPVSWPASIMTITLHGDSGVASLPCTRG